MNRQFLQIYHDEIPEFITEFSRTSALLRLKGAGMDCGCEYTFFPIFQNRPAYNRYWHSLGVAGIVWHFTHERKEAIAALFHDVATPAFSHVIDFYHGDHLKQESTEDATSVIIRNSEEIMSLLKKYDLRVEEVSNYHDYPIADNDSPRLSADRLEYSLVNMHRYLNCSLADIKELYDDLTIGLNEEGQKELMFKSFDKALVFGEGALKNGMMYSSDPDRFTMEYLARILRKAVKEGRLLEKDFFFPESEVIKRLDKDEWENFRAVKDIEKSISEPKGEDWFKVDTKKRWIDPYVLNKGRLSELDQAFNNQLQSFRSFKYDYWLRGIR